ncbi:MurR/RpiR family transcriptional regulator [Streptomyces sp. TS71-3]|uniref:MurR/RpiR family transcriptional regulator n=1 Tax=Streptomyces sp. TS71-3 TaxID=2733862 RepID=UPI001B06DE65|nr:MurR/RpiR family transcriptional regulator [Streptomyces sp. TS71-3]GHJ35528.1 putative HTH-type transcriptional regulator YbbH [Streptomyces sp. TS71-3]
MVVPAEDAGNVLHLINSKLPYLPTALRTIGEHLQAHPQQAQAMTISQLASACRVAESTVSRFVRELGMDSYHALRVSLAEATFATRTSGARVGEGFVYEGILRGDEPASIVGKIERSSRQALAQTAQQVSREALGRAVDLLQDAATVVFCCMGASSIAAEEGVLRFTRAGKKCLLYRDQSVQVMLATILTPQDVLIGISDSGKSSSIVEAMRLARRTGAPSIGITSAEDSPVAQLSDVPLYTSNLPGEGLYGESVTSKWGQLLLIDILYASYAARHFDGTLHHLKETYEAGIRHSRSPRPGRTEG